MRKQCKRVYEVPHIPLKRVYEVFQDFEGYMGVEKGIFSPQRGIFEVYLGGWKSSCINHGYWVPEHAVSKKVDFIVILTSSDTDCTYLSIGFFAKIENVFFQCARIFWRKT